MEFPHLGDQCNEKSCHQLDFLPVKCDGCKKSFCGQHWTYEGHHCSTPRLKDVQVPVCPMCDKPVPSKPGSVPDEAVSRHLDRDCKADTKRNPRCSKAKCKIRELIKVNCDQCSLNFCLKHRHPQDHECEGKPSKRPMSDAGRAALARNQESSQSRNNPIGIAKYFQRQNQQQQPITASRSTVTSSRQPMRSASQFQGNLSEDEALARALQASLNENQNQPQGELSQEEQDRLLALSLAQSEGNQQPPANRNQQTSVSSDKSCQIS